MPPQLWLLLIFSHHLTEGTTIITNFTLLLETPPSAADGNFVIESLGQTSGFALVILLLLLAFSLLSWTIIIRKWLTFRLIGNRTREFVSLFRKSSRLSEVDAACEHYRGTPLAGIFLSGYQELNAQIQTLKPQTSEHPPLSDRHLVGIQRTLQRASAAELSALEKGLSWLATTGSVTPFIGLLGTVAGIIDAFNGLGEGTTSIQAVAPGIADALFATGAGLFAAIPAVIAYNHFVGAMKNVAGEMDDFSSEFLNLVQRSFS